jgi:hypothetical protein
MVRRTRIKRKQKIVSFVIWVVVPCSLVGGYQHFGGTYRLHLQGWLCYVRLG